METFGWNYLSADDKQSVLRGIDDGRAYGGPYHVEIHPADRCNIECFFCSTAAIRGTDELPLQRIEELIGELRELGTRSLRLSGGGEPLFHRQTTAVLDAIAATPLRLENLTTNGVLLTERVADALLRAGDMITVSLNTADPKSYAAMMQTPERNYSRVVDNVRDFVARRKAAKQRTPLVNLQFLVWKDNFRTIPAMYDLARELGVDTILFNGLAFLRDDQKMNAAETAAMMDLYKDVVRRDEYRKIRVIESYEQDINALLSEMNAELAADRSKRSAASRLVSLLARRDFTLREKLEHRRRMREVRRITSQSAGLDENCVIGWHSMVVRTTGAVAPCCILQGKQLGNVFESSVREVWFGEAYDRFRSELSLIIRNGKGWRHDPQRDQTVGAICGLSGAETCPVKSYYRADVPFSQRLAEAARR